MPPAVLEGCVLPAGEAGEGKSWSCWESGEAGSGLGIAAVGDGKDTKYGVQDELLLLV